MENAKRHLTASQVSEVYMKKRSKAYQQTGYRYARNITNKYFIERLFAFALDTCVMFLPIALWLLLLLMIFGNLLPIQFYNMVQILTFAMLVISILCFNPILSSKSNGQTLGKYFYDFKVVRKDHKEASSKSLFLREFLGFSIPTFVLILFTNLIGVILYWVIDFLFAFVHPAHISLIDAMLGLRVVVLHDASDKEIVEEVKEIAEPKEEIVEEVMEAPCGTIDLHMHSNFSDDGQYNVEELFQMAAKRGLKTISICDHNSIKGNLIAKRMSSLYHIDYIPGVEFDCRYEKHHLRILGYFIDYSNDIYKHIENEALKREKEASLRRVERFKEFTNLDVDMDALVEKNRFLKISEEMIVRQVLQNPDYLLEPILQSYLMMEDREAAILKMVEDFYGIGAPCYVGVRHPKLEDVLEVIHLTGGVAVMSWAKPTLSYGTTFVDEIISKGIDGIEVFTPYYDEKDMAQLLKLAKEKKVFVTAGSDFHGDRHPEIAIGQTGCPIEAERIVQNFIDSHA